MNDDLSDNALDLILRFESDDDSVAPENGYNKHPEWPEGESGITIGIGYDLGYTVKHKFLMDWKSLGDSEIAGLYGCIGVTGEDAHDLLHGVKDIVIPFETALGVFKAITVPEEIAKTKSAFPKSEQLPPDAFGALVSLVYNRGTKMTGDRRREMRNIREVVMGFAPQSSCLRVVADNLMAMKQLWPDSDGLQRRREAEAKLVEGCITA